MTRPSFLHGELVVRVERILIFEARAAVSSQCARDNCELRRVGREQVSAL